MPLRDVIGHRRLIGLLARAVPRDALPPSLIFSGPAGVGKRTVAVALAQAVNCLNVRDDGDACGACLACTRIARGVHPDVLIVVPEESGSIKVDQIRDVVSRSAYRPFEARRRVVIIDDADAMVESAQNALLKTLEEPPSTSLFLLVTSRPDVLLPTVRSRCPQMRFWALEPADVAAALMRLGQSEAQAREAAAAADGSIGRALELASGDLEQTRALVGRVLADAASNSEPRRRLEGARLLVTPSGRTGTIERSELAAELRVMASLVRDAELLANGGDRRALANPDAQPALARLTPFAGERGVRAFAAIDEALAALDGNAGVKIVADWLMVRL